MFVLLFVSSDINSNLNPFLFFSRISTWITRKQDFRASLLCSSWNPYPWGVNIISIMSPLPIATNIVRCWNSSLDFCWLHWIIINKLVNIKQYWIDYVYIWCINQIFKQWIRQSHVVRPPNSDTLIGPISPRYDLAYDIDNTVISP